MDNITHTLTGLALSRAGFNRKIRFATVAILIGANLPDLDIVSRLGGSATYLKDHRGPTHSVLGITVLAALLAGLVYFFGKHTLPKNTAPPLDAKWLFFGCWAATASHLLLDLTNAYGVRALWPVTNLWFAWDIEPIVDPILMAILIAALGLPSLLRLVSEEVGAKKPLRHQGAIIGLCLVAGIGGLRYFAHSRAINMLGGRTYHEKNPEQIGAFPALINPFAWTGVVKTEIAIEILPVDALADDISTEDERLFNLSGNSPALISALTARDAKIFMAFARFPWADVHQTEDGWSITIRDLRFLSAYSERSGFVVTVELDRQLRVRSQSFSFMGKEQSDQT